jgi:hypothetical protein
MGQNDHEHGCDSARAMLHPFTRSDTRLWKFNGARRLTTRLVRPVASLFFSGGQAWLQWRVGRALAGHSVARAEKRALFNVAFQNHALPSKLLVRAGSTSPTVASRVRD